MLPASNPIVSELLGYADKLDRRAMTKQEVDELTMFEAIQCADHAELPVLAKKFIEAGNDPAALLCLDHIFSSPFCFKGLSNADIFALLSLYLEYVRLLDRFRRDDSLAEGSRRQRLFGFQVLGEDRYLTPKHTLIHEILAVQSGMNEESADGYAHTYNDIAWSILQLISIRNSKRTELLNIACRKVHGFAPCLVFMVRGQCSLGESCSFQHIQSDYFAVEWCHLRIRLILLQLQILNLARYYPLPTVNFWLGVLYSALHPPIHKLGSRANLDLTKIPEAADGFRIVRDWVWFVCDGLWYGSSPINVIYNDHFGPQFMVACTLAFDFDRENATSYIPRTRMYRWNQWPDCLVREGGYYIVRDFVNFAKGEADNALVSGAWFLHQVLRSQLPMDLNHFWFINLIRPLPNPGKRFSALLPFTRTLVELMQRIYKQVELPPQPDRVDQFKADGLRVNTITGPFYIARICMCLCLLGLNTNDDRYKDQILASVQSLCKGLEWHFTPSIYRRYVHARNWNDLVFALTESLKNTPMDEMITLLREGIPVPYERRWDHVRPVVYSRLDEVPALLLADPSITGAVTHHQWPRAGAESSGDYDGQEQRINMPQERIFEENEVEEELGAGGADEQGIDQELAKAARTIQRAYRHHLERRRGKAAKKIQVSYRRYLKRKNIVRKGLDATQARYWQLFRKRSMEMRWTEGSRYHLLFRVPLAYILVCLDVAGVFVESKKKEAKKRLTDGGDNALQQYSKLLKRTIELQKILSPSSEFHEEKSVRDLQRVVLEVKAVMESLEGIPESIGTRNQIEKCWERGYKWIFEKQGGKAKGRKANKPKLVLDHENVSHLY